MQLAYCGVCKSGVSTTAMNSNTCMCACVDGPALLYPSYHRNHVGYAGQWRTWDVSGTSAADGEAGASSGPESDVPTQISSSGALIDDGVNIRLWRVTDSQTFTVQQSNLYQVKTCPADTWLMHWQSLLSHSCTASTWWLVVFIFLRVHLPSKLLCAYYDNLLQPVTLVTIPDSVQDGWSVHSLPALPHRQHHGRSAGWIRPQSLELQT